MIKNQRGNSIIEIMITIIILTVGIVGTYGILNSGTKLSITSENRLKAINIAREGIEAVENIRDTNWMKFSSDFRNCWKVKDYDITCIGNTGKEISTGSYILVQNNSLWYLSGSILPESTYSGYLVQFPVFIDTNGLVVSSGNTAPCTSSITSDCKTIYTREIQIAHSDNDHMKVNSIVKWVDSSNNSGAHVINLETVLTNWKKNF